MRIPVEKKAGFFPIVPSFSFENPPVNLVDNHMTL